MQNMGCLKKRLSPHEAKLKIAMQSNDFQWIDFVSKLEHSNKMNVESYIGMSNGFKMKFKHR